MEETYFLALSNTERCLIIDSLNMLRNKLFYQGKYTDDIDDLFIRVIDAKKKNFKIIHTEG